VPCATGVQAKCGAQSRRLVELTKRQEPREKLRRSRGTAGGKSFQAVLLSPDPFSTASETYEFNCSEESAKG
jgi:hypothetical protein